jgi:hypothetical protein
MDFRRDGPLHGLMHRSKTVPHSNTSSARASKDGAIVTRSTFAVFRGLLPTEWVNLDVFLQVEADFKGFLVNLMVMSSQARCAHAKIRQEETSAG